MRLVDDYGASDYASIEADNTSAFNCRRATGASRWSQHAYGRAIDVNPIENPYVYADGTTTHARSRPYLDRAERRPGMAYRGGTLVRAFPRAGWGWGGTWRRPDRLPALLGERDLNDEGAPSGRPRKTQARVRPLAGTRLK